MGINQFDKKDLFTIPNIITYFRILCIPAFIAVSVLAGMRNNEILIYVALGIFIVAAASDLVDGILARKFNWGSGLGMLLDPLADKLMHISIVICLCFAIKIEGITCYGYENFLHWGFLVAIAAKELLMILLAPIVAKKGVEVKANMIGKVASATLSIGVILCFFHKYVAPWDWAVIATATLQSYFAFINYCVVILKQLKQLKNEKLNATSANVDIVEKETETKDN